MASEDAGAHAAVDAPDAHVIGVAEIRQPRHALAQRELERRDRGQRRPQPQNLQQLAGGAVGRHDAFAEAVGEERGFRMIVGRRAGHGTGGECNAQDQRA